MEKRRKLDKDYYKEENNKTLGKIELITISMTAHQ